MLSDDDVERFVTDGFVPIRSAFDRSVAERCAEEIWAHLDADRDDPSSWTEPVVRLQGFGTAPFREAANTAALHEAFDQLVGAGRWIPRDGLGTIPVRFPSPAEPGDDGWHVETNFHGPGVDGRPRCARVPLTPFGGGEGRVDLRCHGRALLMLFLFSDVGPDDAPTRIRVGSHLDVPPFLADAGDDGREWLALCGDVVPASAHRPEALATGSAGDVFLCHPFVVHAAQPHRGTRPRLMAQPPLLPSGRMDLDDPAPPPVVRAVRSGLDGSPPR